MIIRITYWKSTHDFYISSFTFSYRSWKKTFCSFYFSLSSENFGNDDVGESKDKTKKKSKKKIIQPKKVVEDDDDESTDSEFELDLDVEDGISVQVQDELSKYLSKNKTMVKKLDPKVKDFLGKCVNQKELTKVARSS